MSEHSQLLEQLIQLSRAVGKEERNLAILGEGNTSALAPGGATFWVKASGSQLGTITQEGFTQVKIDAVLALCAREEMSELEIQAIWPEVQVDPTQRRPSVETFLHALCLTEGGAHWVAHTHPISCNAILCSRLGAQPFLNHLFPDGIVVCGLHPAVIPYVDPGFALAKVIRAELRRYQEAWGKSPKLLLMENHGIVALGQNATEALNISLMADKWARTILGAYALGGPRFMPMEEANRIDQRLDEHYRRKAITG